jgi:hypothetical protein
MGVVDVQPQLLVPLDERVQFADRGEVPVHAVEAVDREPDPRWCPASARIRSSRRPMSLWGNNPTDPGEASRAAVCTLLCTCRSRISASRSSTMTGSAAMWPSVVVGVSKVGRSNRVVSSSSASAYPGADS